MQARFLLGPAGSGKTHRCLAEIRAELLRSPEGLPLVLLAPKQATFQLERQLLADGSLAGYTRLQILSFERLAEFVLEEFSPSPPRLLDEEGRVMVLRALLAQKQNELKIFRATARLPGFAEQLSLLLRELQRHHHSPERLFALASKIHSPPPLRDKLLDLALLLRAYLDWLKGHQLQDANCLLDFAAEALRSRSPIANRQPPARLGGLWLDGFAEMTPQELDFLAGLAPLCERATIAFCLEGEPKTALSWLSPWSVVSQAFQNCYQRLASSPECRVEVEILERRPGHGRFAHSLALAHLERHWASPRPFEREAAGSAAENGRDARSALEETLRVAVCPNPQGEAVLAAREILRHVRGGGRYRDCAVLLRTLECYHDELRRVFRRYEIPFFLDRREPAAHHPLAELTRYALRTIAFGWEHDDWFGALKTGLVPADETEIDALENEALARGWKGEVWTRPLTIADDATLQKRIEHWRRILVPPFQQLAKRLAVETTGAQGGPTGADLAEALRAFWNQLHVEQTLEKWSVTAPGPSAIGNRRSAIHTTVWGQMQSWLDSVGLAFPKDPLPLREWLPIVEAGLANLTVGVIPPALDQVSIGTIDRSRNPELQLALVLGVNESVFPAAPPVAGLLTETDRDELETKGVALGPNRRAQLGHERYYGYIACTRARRRLVLTCAARDANDRALNPSPFLTHLNRLFPTLETERYAPSQAWRDSEHACELIAPLLQAPTAHGDRPPVADLEAAPSLLPLREQLRALASYAPAASLSPALAGRLYGPVLRTSVSALEQFAACPFKFFVHSGIRAEERRLFEADARERGGFQHEVLKRFHLELEHEDRKWRELTPAQARERIGRIAEQVGAEFREGLFQASHQNIFAARSLTTALQDFIETAVGWMQHYGFDPRAVEVSFGGESDALPAWEMDLGDGHRMVFRGKIDRVDLAASPVRDEMRCVVIDYKSGARKIDPLLLEQGIQIQLPAYLAALRRVGGGSPAFGAARLIPAGGFYVNLRGNYRAGANRREVLGEAGEARREAYRHFGRFSVEALPQLDRGAPGSNSGQFNYALKKNGESDRRRPDLLDAGEFTALLDHLESLLREMGRRIFAGNAEVDPYRKGAETACESCDFRAICRIDPWKHRFRVLEKISTAGKET